MSPDDKKSLLEKLRREVDDLDDRIVELLEKRFRNSVIIGSLKKELGTDLHSPEREEQIFRNVLNLEIKNISPEALKRIYRVILDESLSVQEKAKGNNNA